MTSLELASDNELIEELAKRFDAFIMAGRKVLTTDGKTARRRYWNGDFDACVGLAHGIIQDVTNKNWGVSSEDINES